MVDREKLLETGQELGSSVAGTLSDVAGTLKDKGSKASQRVRSDVRERFEELTDETVTDQEQARLERARQEALIEARQEAQREFREEFQKNVFQEAYDAELTRIEQQRGVRVRDDAENSQQSPQPMQTMAMFGVPTQPPQQQSSDQTSQPPQENPVANLFGVTSRGEDVDVQRDPLFGFEY